MLKIKQLFKISIVFAILIEMTSFAYAHGVQFKSFDHKTIQKQLETDDKKQIEQLPLLMTIAAEKDQTKMDVATRASISNLAGSCLQRNANVGAFAGRGYSDLFAEMQFELDRDGKIIGDPKVTATGGDEAAREVFRDQVLKAVYLCKEAFQKLPKEHYDEWREMKFNIKYSDGF